MRRQSQVRMMSRTSVKATNNGSSLTVCAAWRRSNWGRGSEDVQLSVVDRKEMNVYSTSTSVTNRC